MAVSLRCLKCRRRYIFEHSNTRIYGPVVHTECPFCKKKIRKNFSKFIELQLGAGKFGKYDLISKMASFASILEKAAKC